MARKLQTAVALLTVFATVSAAPGPAATTVTDPTKPLSFDVELAQVEGSGVTGIAHLVLRGDRLTVLIRAFGFESHQVVPVAILGPEGARAAQCPPGVEELEETAEPSRTRSENSERRPALGPMTLDPPPRADIRGALISQQTYTVDAGRLTPLVDRVVVLRSAEDEDGEPLACGRIVSYG